MLHHIKELFQKTLDLKVEKFGENQSNSRGRSALENATQQPIQQNQHGRSMIEMLGVLLAIVGILSIGALAGYRYGMDKHRANATMNDINLRGVDLIIQASRNIPLNLDEWSTKSSAGYTFGTPEQADGFIKLPIGGLPERVCEMVVDGLSSQFDVDINGVRTDADATCGEDNTVTVYFEGGSGDGTDAACEGVTCPECQLCVNGSCTSSPDNMTCTNGYCESGLCIKEEKPKYSDFECKVAEDCVASDSECVVCNGSCDTWTNNGNECHDDHTGETGTCYWGHCQAGGCTSNNDCPSGYFCADTNESCTEAHPKACQKLNFVRKTITLSDGTRETWYASNYWLSWWDTENACKKLGKRLARADEMVVGFDSTQFSWKTYTRTERAEKLNEALGGDIYYWLSDSYNSCYAFSVDLSFGAVGVYDRNGGDLALCR